jgi:hypothetical protein
MSTVRISVLSVCWTAIGHPSPIVRRQRARSRVENGTIQFVASGATRNKTPVGANETHGRRNGDARETKRTAARLTTRSDRRPYDNATVRVEYRRVVEANVSPPADEPDDIDDAGESDGTDHPVEFDAPTGATDDGDAIDDTGEDGADDASVPADTAGDDAPETTTESLRRTLDGLLPEAGADSRWWYWIAAVPVYFLVTLVGGAIAAGLFLFAGLLDVAGLGGLASFSTFLVFGAVASLFGISGLVVAVLFPVATYVDARAIETLDGEWTPDPVLWGLLAVVAVLVTNFVVSVPLSLYYLYRRHEALGTP